MKVLLSWLREFAPIDGDPIELGDTLSDLGMAVESLDVLGAGLDGIVVARVLDLRPHPDADRIQLVDVDAGDGSEIRFKLKLGGRRFHSRRLRDLTGIEARENQARQILHAHRDAMERMVERLLEQETVDREEMAEIFSDVPKWEHASSGSFRIQPPKPSDNGHARGLADVAAGEEDDDSVNVGS